MLQLEFPLPPISLNHCEQSTRDGRRYKTKEYMQFKRLMDGYLNKYGPEMFSFVGCFDLTKHAFITLHTYYLPKSKLLTKKNRISKTSGDTDNFAKPINDLIFRKLKTYNSYVDDALNLDTHGRKRLGQSRGAYFKVSIQLVEFESYIRSSDEL